MRRTIVYIDGFNLYYGILKNSPHRWLNLERFFSLLRAADDIEEIQYFTALVNGHDKQLKQKAYLRALETTPLVTTILGKFKKTTRNCTVKQCQFKGVRRFSVPEEKRTDVNIAVSMLDDAYRDRCDQFVLVSGDADLVPPIARIKLHFPQKQVFVYVPGRDPKRTAAVEIRLAADKHRTLPPDLLKKCQFPIRIPDGSGGWIEKPNGW